MCLEDVCSTVNPSLLDSNAKPIPVTVKEADRPKTSLGQKYYILTPAKDLKPGSSYKVVLKYSETIKYSEIERTRSFETGTHIDKRPPALDKAQIKADIKWVGDKISAMLHRPGTCGPGEYDVKEARKAGFKIKESDHLPEHYNVVLTVGGVVDDTNYTLFHLFELMDDGTRKDMGKFDAPVINIERIDAKDAGKSKRYELQAEDALGNVQTERLGFRIDFNKTNSSLIR